MHVCALVYSMIAFFVLLLFLLSFFSLHSGSVYTCGLNDGHQLGFGGKQVPILTPTLIRSLKNREVLVFCSKDFHVSNWSTSTLYLYQDNLACIIHVFLKFSE